jgi:hypothetical protein
MTKLLASSYSCCQLTSLLHAPTLAEGSIRRRLAAASEMAPACQGCGGSVCTLCLTTRLLNDDRLPTERVRALRLPSVAGMHAPTTPVASRLAEAMAASKEPGGADERLAWVSCAGGM